MSQENIQQSLERLQLKDFIPIKGMRNYDERNNLPIDLSEVFCDRPRASTRSTIIRWYNIAIGTGLAYAAYQAGSYLKDNF